MQTLELKVERTETQTIINWTRKDTENQDWFSASVWIEEGNLTDEQVLELAKSRTDEGIEIILK